MMIPNVSFSIFSLHFEVVGEAMRVFGPLMYASSALQ